MSDLIARYKDSHGMTPTQADKWMAEAVAALRQKEEHLQSALTDLRQFTRSLAAAERELAELRAQQPDREPTPAMFIAGTKALAEAEGSYARHVWYAMYDAAPPAQQPKAE